MRKNNGLREKFGIDNMQKFQKFLRTRSFGLILSAVKALEDGRNNHQIFDNWKEYDENYTPPELQVVEKESHPSRQLYLFSSSKGVKGVK
ncbi:MAG: hypothetical protein AUJ34_00395 [Parcubacteria group bacterium CG1_02_41_12]|nr:MAG: hypothetical protein AUJ34_00395 [Parcubacteria group bacterium CG1_02_41_12]PIR56781.1 MAG: hypothetical protein COU72_04450 [Parcubacteria group bacterium CG10_big_fil_rev_8_21_14_0_10_41_35]